MPALQNPECVKVCPTEASHIAADGTIQIDKSKCIGCQFCVMACLYNVRYLNEDEHAVEKCTLCTQKTAQGELPHCVAQCGGRARFFGDLDEGIDNFECPANPTKQGKGVSYDDVHNARQKYSDIAKPYDASDVHHLPNVGNNPKFLYVLRGRTWQGKE